MTMKEFKDLNKASGFYFFSDSTMQFFNSLVETELLKGNYFITSERFEDSNRKLWPKEYAVRKADLHTGSVETVSKNHKSIKEAKEAIKRERRY